MIKTYVVRDLAGPAGQIVGDRRRYPGEAVGLSEDDAKRELERNIVEPLVADEQSPNRTPKGRGGGSAKSDGRGLAGD